MPRRALVTVLATLALATSAHAIPMVAASGTSLVRFDSASLGTTTTVPITGLQGGETLVGIDYRPATGELYGVGSTSRLYKLNVITGEADQAPPSGDPFSPGLSGTAYGTDFNPMVDRIRQVSNTEQNLRLQPDTGLVAGSDTPLNPLGNVVAAAYSNNVPGASSTTLYDIDSAAGTLVTQNPPNGGTLATVGSLGLGTNLNESIGFDITADDAAFATITTGGVSRLYSINLATGAATPTGTIGVGGTPFLGLAAAHSYIRVTAPAGQVAEGETATFTLTRHGYLPPALAVDFAAVAGSATADDFTPSSGTVSWPAGDANPKSITVPITDDATDEAAETLSVTVTAPAGTRAVPASTQATIAASDPKPAATPTPSVTPAPDRTAPVLSLSGSRSQRLATARRSGVSLGIATSEACLLSAGATISAKLARKRKVSRTMGSLTAIALPGAAKTFRVKPTDKAARALRREKSVPVTLTTRCTDPALNRSATATRRVTLKR